MSVRAYTTISPTHHLGDRQQVCVSSWIKHGIPVTTVNGHTESIAAPDGVTVAKVDPSTLYARPYIYLDSIIQRAKDDGTQVAIIVNSDIELRDPTDILGSYIDRAGAGALCIANRIDHNGDEGGAVYPHGWDVFIAPIGFLASLPKSLFVLGQTWWDYWLPYRAMRQGLPLVQVNEPLFFHHRHPQQHSTQEWQRMTEHFCWMEGVMKGQRPHYVCGKVYSDIKRHAR